MKINSVITTAVLATTVAAAPLNGDANNNDVAKRGRGGYDVTGVSSKFALGDDLTDEPTPATPDTDPKAKRSEPKLPCCVM